MNTLGKPRSTVTIPDEDKSEMWAVYVIGLLFLVMIALCMFLFMGLGSAQMMTAPIPMAPWL